MLFLRNHLTYLLDCMLLLTSPKLRVGPSSIQSTVITSTVLGRHVIDIYIMYHSLLLDSYQKLS